MVCKKLKLYLDLLDYGNRPKFLDKYFIAPSLIRLKNVGYFCGMDYASREIYSFDEKISRYDHSINVALITWNLTKDMKATLAGFFHDVSTPCFSHVIDYMNNDYEKQESTEEKTGDIIKNDKYILKCLEQDGVVVDDIIDFKKYSVVDLDRPMLCADRLDGVILTGLYWTKNITILDVENIINDLIIVNNEIDQCEIGFKSYSIAKLVLDTSELIDKYCHSKEDNYMMELLAKITKRVIDLNFISYDDLFILNEDDIFKIYENIDDVEVVNNLDVFKNVKLEEIDELEMPFVKIRNLNPFVNSIRLKS